MLKITLNSEPTIKVWGRALAKPHRQRIRHLHVFNDNWKRKKDLNPKCMLICVFRKQRLKPSMVRSAFLASGENAATRTDIFWSRRCSRRNQEDLHGSAGWPKDLTLASSVTQRASLLLFRVTEERKMPLPVYFGQSAHWELVISVSLSPCG